MRYLSRQGLILIVVSSLLFVPQALAEQPERIGSVTNLQGQVTVRHEGNTQPEPLAVQSPLYPMDTIQTAAASKIKLGFLDGTSLTLGEQSQLQITAFVYAPQHGTHRTLFTIPLGVFRLIARHILPQSQFEVATTTVVAALRGTECLGEVTPESTALVVLQGTVSVSHIRPDRPGEVVLTQGMETGMSKEKTLQDESMGLLARTTGMGIDVTSEQAPTAPQRWDPSRVKTLWQATRLP